MKSYKIKGKFNISPIAYGDLNIYEASEWGSNNFDTHRAKRNQQIRYKISLPAGSKISVKEALQMIVKDKMFGVIFARPHKDHKNADYLLLKWQPTDILMIEALAIGLEKAGKVWGLKVTVENQRHP